MLYERWRQIANERKGEFALHDIASGRRWTFAELLTAGEARSVSGPIVFPTGQSPEFILDVLAAWREDLVVQPLESGQTAQPVPLPPKGCIHLKSTSATSGVARHVAFTGAQLFADAENIVATMGLRADWPNLGVISMAHSYGFSNLVLPLLLHGIPLVIAASALPEGIRQAAQTQKSITLPAVPALWRAWHDASAIPKNARLGISAGAPLPLGLERNVFDQIGFKIHNFYGASECGGIAYDSSEIPRDDASCVGAPLVGVTVDLENETGLVVRGAAVGETYWPEKSPLLGNGEFHSGDLVGLTNGVVYLRGRGGDQINIAGRKVSPESIERELLAHPRVRECLVFGAPDANEHRAENIVAVVVSDASESELRDFLLNRVPAWQVPREWRFVDSMPVNHRGKISRAEWRRNTSS